MHLGTDSARAYCPYCGEPIELVVDASVDHQRYVEDCFVCCRPMVVDATWTEEAGAAVSVGREDD